jgi:hypothetical protein
MNKALSKLALIRSFDELKRQWVSSPFELETQAEIKGTMSEENIDNRM